MEAKKRTEYKSAFGETEVPVFCRMINHFLGFLSAKHQCQCVCVCVSFGFASFFGHWKNVFTGQ